MRERARFFYIWVETRGQEYPTVLILRGNLAGITVNCIIISKRVMLIRMTLQRRACSTPNKPNKRGHYQEKHNAQQQAQHTKPNSHNHMTGCVNTLDLMST